MKKPQRFINNFIPDIYNVLYYDFDMCSRNI